MSQGRVRKGNFSNGSPVNLPLPGNVVNWLPSPGAFCNPVPASGAQDPSRNFIGMSPVVTPKFTPDSGTYTELQVVDIESKGAEAIYVTTDSTNPTIHSPLYEGSVTVRTSQTVKAIAVVKGVSSAVGTSVYVIS